MDQNIEERLTFLQESKHSHFRLAEGIGSQIDLIDIYAFMVLKRSLSLVFGFTTMIRDKNFMCAAPLLRLQIDNLLRFHAAFLVIDQEKFVFEVIQGKEVRKLVDKTGKRMSDARLQDTLANEYPWLKEVYKRTSGYIHLSDAHFYNTVRSSRSGKEGAIEFYIGPDDKLVSEEVYREALEDMIFITHALLTYLGIFI